MDDTSLPATPASSGVPAPDAPNTRENTRSFRYAVAAIIAFVLIVGLLLLLSQRIGKKSSRQAVPETIDSKNNNSVSKVPVNGLELNKKYTSPLCNFLYPDSWVAEETKKGETYREIQMHAPNAKLTEVRIITTCITGLSQNELDTLNDIYKNTLLYTTEDIHIGKFQKILKEVIPQNDVINQQNPPVSQKRIAIIYSKSNMYRFIMTYPGQVEDLKYETILKRILKTFTFQQ